MNVGGGRRGRGVWLAATLLSVCPRAAVATEVAYHHQFDCVWMNTGLCKATLSTLSSRKRYIRWMIIDLIIDHPSSGQTWGNFSLDHQIPEDVISQCNTFCASSLKTIVRFYDNSNWIEDVSGESSSKENNIHPPVICKTPDFHTCNYVSAKWMLLFTDHESCSSHLHGLQRHSWKCPVRTVTVPISHSGVMYALRWRKRTNLEKDDREQRNSVTQAAVTYLSHLNGTEAATICGQVISQSIHNLFHQGWHMHV